MSTKHCLICPGIKWLYCTHLFQYNDKITKIQLKPSDSTRGSLVRPGYPGLCFVEIVWIITTKDQVVAHAQNHQLCTRWFHRHGKRGWIPKFLKRFYISKRRKKLHKVIMGWKSKVYSRMCLSSVVFWMCVCCVVFGYSNIQTFGSHRLSASC